MGNYEQLKQSVSDVIKTNGNQEITGSILQNVLLAIISSVGANATFAGIATPTTNPGTPDGPVFYLASEAGTYTNFNAVELQAGLSVLMWNGSWNSQQIFSIDNEPTAGSDNLVKSGGVAEELALGAVYDVSAKNPTSGVNNDGKWESLSALLSDANLNTLIPTTVRKGGMSIKFIQSSDNKYVRYNLIVDSFTTDVTKWQKEDNNLIYQALISSEYKAGGAYSISAGNVRWSENANWYGFVVKDLKTGDIVEVRGVGGVSYRLWYACNGTVIQRNADASVNAMEPIRITIQEGENALYGSLSASYIADSYVKVITSGDNLNKRVSGIETSLMSDEDNISVLKQLLYADNKQKISLVSGTNKQGVDFPANTFVASKPVLLFVLDPSKILSQYSVVTGKGVTIERNVYSYEPNKVYIIDNLNPTALSNALHFYTYGSYISGSGDVLFFITQDIRNVFAYLYELKKMFDADSIPTYGSEKFAKSGGIYNAITEKLLSAIENSLNGGYINDQGNVAFSEGSNWKSFYLTNLNVGDIVEIKGIGGASYRLWYACKTKNEVMPKIKRQADASLDASTPIRITIEGQEDSIYVSMNVASYTAGGYVKVISTSNYLNKKINNIEQMFATKRLVCIGDSITQGAGASDYSNTYYWKLLTALKSAGVVTDGNNLGSGGAKSSNISAYCGANKLVITSDVTIPATGSVTIGLNINVFDAGGGVTYCNPCTLGGIKGELSYANNSYTFTRAEDGDVTFVCAGTALLTQANLYALSSEVLVCFAGANDNIDTYPDKEEALLANIDNIVRLSRNGKFVVIIPYVGSTSTDFRDKVLSKYGSRCLDMYTYMVNMSVIDAVAQGLLPSGEQSNWASLLLTDGVHPNDIGHTLLAQQIYKRIIELDF